MAQFELTNRLVKLFASLDRSKYRRLEQLFPAEGSKCVTDLLDTYECRWLFALPQWLETHAALISSSKIENCIEAGPSMLRRLTRLPSAPEVTAFFTPKEYEPFTPQRDELVVALDGIQDPGNMGTIIRSCGWMGVKRIVASSDTVDCYNPKSVQASMGALAHVEVCYTDLPAWLASLPAETAVYGTFLNGENIYTHRLSEGGVLVTGNEGHGISEQVEALVNARLFIPPYPAEALGQDSLNAGMATSIALSQFRARIFSKSTN